MEIETNDPNPANQPTSQPASQPASRPASQPTNQLTRPNRPPSYRANENPVPHIDTRAKYLNSDVLRRGRRQRRSLQNPATEPCEVWGRVFYCWLAPYKIHPRASLRIFPPTACLRWTGTPVSDFHVPLREWASCGPRPLPHVGDLQPNDGSSSIL